MLIVLDFIKNAVDFGHQVKNLAPYTLTYSGANGDQVIRKSKDPAYLAAQYIYALWLVLMVIKALVGFRANLKVCPRAILLASAKGTKTMSRYPIELMPCAFLS